MAGDSRAASWADHSSAGPGGHPSAGIHRPPPGWAGGGPRVRLFQAPDDLDVMVADLLAQRIPVQAKHMGGLDLVPPGSCQTEGNQRDFQFPQHAIVQAGRRSEEHTSELQSLMRISY